MRIRLSLAAILIGAGPSLAAQSVSLGLTAGAATPGGLLAESVGSRAGLSFGLQARVKLDGGIALVPRIDKVKFSQDTEGSLGAYPFQHVETSLLSLGVDYNWFPMGQAGDGFYLTAGLGSLHKKDLYQLGAGNPTEPNQSKNRFYYAFGVGAVFGKHVDLSARFQFFSDKGPMQLRSAESGGYVASESQSSVVTVGLAFYF